MAKEQARWIQKGVKVTELRYGKAAQTEFEVLQISVLYLLLLQL